jgi:hypothetical protein
MLLLIAERHWYDGVLKFGIITEEYDADVDWDYIHLHPFRRYSQIL